MLKKIKSLFITEIEEPIGEEQPVEKVEKVDMEKGEKPEKEQRKEQKKEESEFTGRGEPNPDFIGILINAMQDAREEDFDYLHFKNNLKSLNHLDFDAPTQFKTAYAIAKNQGVDRDSLVKSASSFIEVLNREEDKFNQSLESQKQNRIELRKENIRKLRDQIFEKQTEIEKLEEEIRQLEGDIGEEKNELQENRERIERTSADFSASLEFLKKKITADIESLKKYLD